MNKYIILFLFIISTATLQAQQYVSISGFIKNIENGEALIGAYVIDTANLTGTVTNSYGFYSIDVPAKSTSIKFSYIGYKSIVVQLNTKADTTINILLSQNSVLDEVVITGGYNSLKSNLTGIETITPKMVNSLPVIMGESDIIKTLTLLPGVSFGNESTAGYFVRGSSSDQNLLLIDGVPVYNPYHLHGYFSVFNTDAINSATLYKGAVPSEFGGRLSSVLDIKMREGNSKKIAGSITLGTVTAKALLEGPIIKDKTSFLITARRSMLDVFNPMFSSMVTAFNGMSRVSEDMDLTNYFFFDYNAKVNHKFNDRNRMYINFYQSKDNYQNKNSLYSFNNEIKWQNITSSFRWNHVYSNNLFSNTTFYYTGYNYSSKDELENSADIQNSIQYTTDIKDYSGKIDFNYGIKNHSLKFGAQYLNQIIKPGISTVIQKGEGNTKNIDTSYNSAVNTHNATLYFEDDFSPFEKLSVSAGLHFSGYYTPNKFYPSIQPRFSFNYTPFKKISIKGSYTRMVQHLHLLSNTWSGNPSDIWVPSTSLVKPENSNQIATGITYNVGKYYLSAEAFLKNMNNLIEYSEGASYINNQSDWQNKIETGTGKAYGVELSAKKDIGKITGLFSYTYSKSTRKFEKINNGKEFPYIYDRTHSTSIAIMYKINKKWDMGANWVFATGQPVTIAESYIIINLEEDQYFKYYKSINGARLPNYHRLDVCMNYTKTYTKFNYKISTGVYNAYNRQNPYNIYDIHNGLYINSLLGFMPYITLSFKFN